MCDKNALLWRAVVAMFRLLLRHFHYVVDPPRFQPIPIIEIHFLSHSLKVWLGFRLRV